MHFDVSELRDLDRDLVKGAAKVEAAAPLVVKKVAFDVERDAKVFAPVDTGHLEGSISTSVEGLSAEIGPTASYGDFVEAGTSRMHAQPYMGPATEKNTPAFEEALEKLGAKILD